MSGTSEQTRRLYRRRARRYDKTFWLLRAAGVSDGKYRRRAVHHLQLGPGDTVVDLGCGTGLNFPHLYEKVGPQGQIVGVDLTDAMLRQAAERVSDEGWNNVTLVEADVADFDFPSNVDGIISTLALTLSPSVDDVIRRGAAALREGGRLALVDLKQPEAWPEWLVRFVAWTQSPFGVSMELADRHPWESVREYLHEVHFAEFYLGAIYVSVGEKATAT